MSDLEQRLADALSEGAREAPPGVGLAEAARSRARDRRRTKLVGVAAAVALCVGVPTGVVALTRGSDDTGHRGPAASGADGADDQGIPAGQRVESWHGVTALVPDSWGYGSLQDWCANNGSLPSGSSGRARPRCTSGAPRRRTA